MQNYFTIAEKGTIFYVTIATVIFSPGYFNGVFIPL